MRQCEVFVNNIKAGILTEHDNQEYEFVYDVAYILGKDNAPISATLPIREAPYRSPFLFPFFFNMLSEGENRHIQSQLHHIDKSDDFGILLATAQSDTIGAVTIKPIR